MGRCWYDRNMGFSLRRNVCEASHTRRNLSSSHLGSRTWHKMDLHVGYLGNPNAELTKVENAKGLRRLSSAAKYLKCAATEIQKEFCKPHEYSGTCWIDRSELAPSQQIEDAPDGRANWNPGHLVYKLIGRGTAFVILRALLEVLTNGVRRKDKYTLKRLGMQPATKRIRVPKSEHSIQKIHFTTGI
jgi:hypothetical protein